MIPRPDGTRRHASVTGGSHERFRGGSYTLAIGDRGQRRDAGPDVRLPRPFFGIDDVVRWDTVSVAS